MNFVLTGPCFRHYIVAFPALHLETGICYKGTSRGRARVGSGGAKLPEAGDKCACRLRKYVHMSNT